MVITVDGGKWKPWRHLALALLAMSVLSIGFTVLPAYSANDKAERPTLIIGGSGIDAPVVEALARAFEKKHKNSRIKIISSVESKGAIQGLEDDRIHIAMIPAESAPAGKSGDFATVKYAKSCLVFAVHPSVDKSVTSVSASDIAQIFAGIKTTWPDGKTINVIFRPQGESSSSLLASKFPELKLAFEKAWDRDFWRTEFLEKKNILLLEKINYGFGWANQSYLAASHSGVRFLDFNGVKPSAKTAESGEYPIVQEFSFVFKIPSSDEVESFVSFVKSSAGAEVLRAYEAIPVR
jgi:phosphate transport system substrate-binding protein